MWSHHQINRTTGLLSHILGPRSRSLTQACCSVTMCSPSCCKYLGIFIILLAVVSTLANLLLLFPGLHYKYLVEGHITPEATWCSGIWASSFVVLVAARGIFPNNSKQGCCRYRANMLCQIVYSSVAVVAAALCFLFNTKGLIQGPLCMHNGTEGLKWDRPLKKVDLEAMSYLYKPERWPSACEEPRDVVVWNIVLFSTIMAVSGLQAMFSAVQIVYAILAVIIGPCISKNKVVPA